MGLQQWGAGLSSWMQPVNWNVGIGLGQVQLWQQVLPQSGPLAYKGHCLYLGFKVKVVQQYLGGGGMHCSSVYRAAGRGCSGINSPCGGCHTNPGGALIAGYKGQDSEGG